MLATPKPALSGAGSALRPVPYLRWWICGLLFFATTINYIDRQVLGLLKPVLERELGWTESDYGWIVFAFQSAYALLMPITGRLLDLIGTRLGYTVAVIVWSLAAMSHALARSAVQFSLARFALGIGEAGNFPAAVKTVADWFPARERALATGIFNSGSNIGAVVAPLVVPWIAVQYGWRQAFVLTGAIGFAWVAAWWFLYRQPRNHARLSASELALIEDGQRSIEKSTPVPYGRLLTRKQAWAFLFAKLLTDPIWWFYLYWLPGFLHTTYGLELTQIGLPLIVIYLSADIGSIGGGALSGWFLRWGWSTNRARKISMLICAVAMLPVILVQQAGSNLWLAVGLISLATAAHQGWSANVYTLSSDLFPQRAVGSVVGLGGMGGAIGGMLFAPAVGYWLKWSGGAYGPLFVVAGCAYLVALGIVQLLVPRLERADVE